MTSCIVIILRLADLVLAPAVYPAALLLKFVRQAGVARMPFCKAALIRVGVFPVLDHYYEPLFDGRQLLPSLDRDRELCIDWNVEEQLCLLERFSFNDELKELATVKVDELTFDLDNPTFAAGDAEFLYNLIRLKKPARVLEIGSGNSTLVAIKAIKKNQEEIPGYRCQHVCIEPYEMPWLEKTKVAVIRERVETVDKAIFSDLQSGDFLFIDSSHMIRPRGDVLFEYLELLPSLPEGVIVHVHDIFSPRDYPKQWLIDEVRFWNEQYLLEAFLTENRKWKIIGALNYLHHNHFERLQSKCPFLTCDGEPGSFYIEKIA